MTFDFLWEKYMEYQQSMFKIECDPKLSSQERFDQRFEALYRFQMEFEKMRGK